LHQAVNDLAFSAITGRNAFQDVLRRRSGAGPPEAGAQPGMSWKEFEESFSIEVSKYPVTETDHPPRGSQGMS